MDVMKTPISERIFRHLPCAEKTSQMSAMPLTKTIPVFTFPILKPLYLVKKILDIWLRKSLIFYCLLESHQKCVYLGSF